jgi:hypothetical protein
MSPDEPAQPVAEAAQDGVDAETHVTSLSTARKAEQCAVCRSCDAKYTCPRCSLRSCSAACVTRHKAESGCSGKRETTAFAPLSSMTDATLRSDLVLLEDTERVAVAAKRARGAGASWAGGREAAAKVSPAAAKLQRVRTRGPALQSSEQRRMNRTCVCVAASVSPFGVY